MIKATAWHEDIANTPLSTPHSNCRTWRHANTPLSTPHSNCRTRIYCDIRGSHSGAANSSGLLGCDTVTLGANRSAMLRPVQYSLHRNIFVYSITIPLHPQLHLVWTYQILLCYRPVVILHLTTPLFRITLAHLGPCHTFSGHPLNDTSCPGYFSVTACTWRRRNCSPLQCHEPFNPWHSATDQRNWIITRLPIPKKI